MLGSHYESQNCSIARSLELVGERWTILVLRDVFLGLRRFDQIQRNLGVARNVLAARLDRLVAEEILEKAPYQERPPRYEYRLTAKGLDLWPVIVELLRWGDRHAAPTSGPPIVLRHKGCAGELGEHHVCTSCGRSLEVGDVRAEPGPGAGTRAGTEPGAGLRRSARESRPARPATA